MKQQLNFGDEFELLKVIDENCNTKLSNELIECICKCGKKKSCVKRRLLDGRNTSCGCVKTTNIDTIDSGKWTIVSEVESRVYRGKPHRVIKCRCVCGTEKNVLLSTLVNKQSTSCGCDSYRGKDSTKHIDFGFFNNIKRAARVRSIACDITIEDVEKLYINQNGLCFYTNEPLGDRASRYNRSNMSLDRIDSSKGYTVDNIVLCLPKINLMKQSLGCEEFYRLCSLVCKTRCLQ